MLAQMATEETITIRGGIKKLGNAALSTCTNMKTLNLPKSLNEIGGRTFNNLNRVENINFPNGNDKYMAENGYLYSEGRENLIYVVPTKTEINIKETVEVIKSYAIQGSKVTELIIPDNVTTLEPYIFANAYNLEKIEIGSGVNNLSSGFKNFGNVPADIELTIDPNNQTYKVEGNLILTKDGTEAVAYIDNQEDQIVPEGVKKLQELCFEGCDKATKIVLPSTLAEIENKAFIYCSSLEEIQIPNNVQNIGTIAFSQCKSLQSIKIDKEAGSIEGAPWDVPKGDRVIIWLR